MQQVGLLVEELRQGRCVFVHCISGESRAPVRSRQHECPLCVRTHGVGGGNRVPFDAPAETVETDAAGRLSFLTQGAFNLVSPLLDCPLSASLRRIAFAGFCPTWGPPPARAYLVLPRHSARSALLIRQVSFANFAPAKGREVRTI